MGELIKVEDLSPRWLKHYDFMAFFPEDNEKDDIIVLLIEDVTDLLKLKYNRFWSHIIYDKGLQKFLDTYLRYVKRPYEPIQDGPLQQELFLCVFKVLVRLSTYRESPTHFMGREFYASLMVKHEVLDIAKLFDICSIYGPYNPMLLTKMIGQLFSVIDKLKADLQQAIVLLSKVFVELKQKLIKALSLSDEQAEQRVGEVTELCTYMTDISTTLSSFIKIYPAAIEVLRDEHYVASISKLYDSVIPALEEHYKIDLELQLRFSKKCLLEIVDLIVKDGYLLPLKDEKLTQEMKRQRARDAADELTKLLSQMNAAEEKRNYATFKEQWIGTMIRDYHKKYDFIRQISALDSFVVSARLQQLKDQYTTVCAGVSSGKSTQPAADSAKVQSMVSHIRELLPNYSEGFILVCLNYFKYNQDQVVNSLLESALPADLKSVSHNISMSEAKAMIGTKQDTTASGLSDRTRENEAFDIIKDKSRVLLPKSHRKNDWENEMNDKSWLNDNVKQKLLNTVYDDEPDDSLDEFQNLTIMDGETVDEEQETLRKSLTLRKPNPDEEDEQGENEQQGEDDEDTDEDTESNNNTNAQRGRGTARGTSRGRGERGAHRGRGRGNDVPQEQDDEEEGEDQSSRGGRGGRGAPRGGRGGPRLTGANANKWKSHNRKEMSSRKRKL
eukprot:TRINITY_DN4369_c0_g1_i1.p1 TRINITY_DN4369_c0_g1~~TRINITY_DN4369_c0_g1_i1.p1  ORF type:complete len:782 (-),score=214.74 TRINITY_DN4369_c0_g1_i1:5-2014(-)